MANDSLDFVQRGKVSIVRRQYAEAVKICRLGLLGQPSLLEGRLVLGMALTALGRWDEVLAEMRVALETDANSALAWLLKGEALVGKGDYLQAESTLKRAKELDPSNSKADQLLQEIATARAAGFEGLPAEPTDTKVYPARVSGGTDPDLGNVIVPMPMDRGELVKVPDEDDSQEVEYDEPEDATEVDHDPSKRNRVQKKRDKNGKPSSVLVDFNESEDTVEDSQVATETFRPPVRDKGIGFDGPATATKDFARAQPRPAKSQSHSGPTGVGRKSSQRDAIAEEDTRDDEENSTLTPAEVMRARRLPSLASDHGTGAGTGRRAVDDLPDQSEPSIVLNSSDLIAEDPSREGFPRGFAPTFETQKELVVVGAPL
ncbi:MAG TPA: hypothetical protein VIA18_27575, partial [Polyangia bacterium]|nr:hypothetical protein [Polyangia bacterium]